MADHKELLKSMVQDFIHDKQEQSSVTLHDYLVDKMKTVSGITPEQDHSDLDNE